MRCCSGGVHPVRKRRLLTKQEFGPEEERAYQWLLDEYRDTVDPIADDLETAIRSGEIDLDTLESIRIEVSDRVGNYTNDFEVLFRAGGEQGIAAGRALAARQHRLDISFDVIPDRTLDVLDQWVDEAAGSTLETITEDATRWLRGTHEEGLSIPDIADRLQSDFFDEHVEDFVAERAARTATISTSNAGHHSAYEDADMVIGEQWLTSIDGRERESHAEANNQVVAVGTPFEVGNEYAAHPGDPSLSVGEIANCRCAVAPVFSDELTDDQIEAIEAGERIWISI